MKISIIVALDQNNLIGAEGSMPWDIPEDTGRFRELTLGKPVIMGRKTYESIGGRLSDRYNIVLTHDIDYNADGCAVVHDKTEAKRRARKEIRKCDKEEVMIIGGAQIYDSFLAEANRMYLTRIHDSFSGDVHFSFDREKWKEVDCIDRLNNDPPYSFLLLERK